jgi:capsule polysaccharide export protein KpsE/RkpR
VSVPLLLTDDEKVRVRHHCGYMNVKEAATFMLGSPSGVETQFVIEGALNLVLGSALPLVRTLLTRCDAAEAQLDEDMESLVASKVGGIALRDDEFEKVIQRYEHWRQALANAIGVFCNPYDKRPALSPGGNSINITVSG